MARAWRCVLAVAMVLCLAVPANGHWRPWKKRTIELERIGRYSSGLFAVGAAEISAYDPFSRRLFLVNAANSSIDVLSLTDPTKPELKFSIDVTPYGDQANSVAVHGRVVAAAIQANVKTDPGVVVFFETDGDFISQVTVGALPDMLTFSPDGRKVLAANEGEPNADYSIDPEGSVSIIDLRRGAKRVTQDDVVTAGFTQFTKANIDPRIRIYGPGASVAQDIEPEYITVSHDGKTAWVTLQENNAIGVLDISRGEFTELLALGFKDHRNPLNALDASDRDSAINITTWPVDGMYQPDGIQSFRHHGRTYLITANEGDAREYDTFVEEARVSSLNLDPTAFPNAATLKANGALGRLTVTRALGDTDGDGDYDRLHPLGGRSFSIWTPEGSLVFDSGDLLEQITADAHPTDFNATNDANASFDNRSDNKGPEPEGVEIGEILGRTYAFIGLERPGGVVVFDISNPAAPEFVQYINPRDFAGNAAAGTADDLGPEGLLFIPAHESPIWQPLLVVSNEVSGSVSIYKIKSVKEK